MIAAISRLTTDYVDTEDRLRLSGLIANGPPVAMWLTQRLATRLLAALLQWLDKQVGGTKAAQAPAAAADLQSELVHGFAQEAAVADLKPLERVQAAATDGWLIQSVDLTPQEQGITLIFRTADGQAVGLPLKAQELRQWLAIMRGIWLGAGWPEAPWPEWMKAEAKPDERQIVLH